jgi:hypothetical protein
LDDLPDLVNLITDLHGIIRATHVHDITADLEKG